MSNDTDTPHVNIFLVIAISEDFWSHESHRTSICPKHLGGLMELFRYREIYYLDSLSGLIVDNVIVSYITVTNILFVKIFNSLENLFQNEFGFKFTEFSLLSQNFC